jgi:hypothetical protein
MEFVLMFAGLFCMVPILMGVMAVIIFILVQGMGGLFRNISGWDELARRFPGPSIPPANIQSTSIRLGNVFYRSGAQLGFMPGGLYMAFKGAFHNPPVLIPWHEMKNPQSSILYWQPARRVDIGFPMMMQLTVKETQFQIMKPYLEGQPK